MDASFHALRRLVWPHRRGSGGAGGVIVMLCAVLGSAARADEPTPPDFQPGDISIGEPIPLPFGGRVAAPPATVPANAPPATVPANAPPATIPANDPRTAAAAAASGVPGNGWLGLSVAESPVPGRWRIEDVTPGGPADRAGILAGDELRAVNGLPLRSAEDVSQSLTAIAVDQDVTVAVARAERVSDVVLRAQPRPATRPADPAGIAAPPASAVSVPPGEFAPAPGTPPATPAPRFAVPSASQALPNPVSAAPTPVPAAPTPVPTAPGAFSAAPNAVPAASLPPPVASVPADRGNLPRWQAAPAREPAPAASPFAQSDSRPAVVAPPPLRTPSVIVGSGPAAPAAFVPSAVALPAPSPTGRTALGVRTLPIDPPTQERFRLPAATGAYVVGVVQDLPAGKAGVPPGAVIVAFGDQPVRTPVDLTRLVTNGPLDRPVTLHYVLPGGEPKQAAVVLQSLDAPLERALTGGGEPSAPTAVPRRAERPQDDAAALRAEIGGLRARLERLESLLEAGRQPRR